MKYLISLVISLFAAPLLPAQVVVIDPTAIAHNQANHIVDLAKYVEMVNNQRLSYVDDKALLYLAEVLRLPVQELFPSRTPGNRIHDFMEKLETTRF